MIQRIQLHGRKSTGALSPAVVAGGLCFVSGQLPLDAEGELIQGPIKVQTQLVLENVSRILAEAGSDLSQLVFVSALLADIADWDEFDAAYRSVLAPHGFPGRIAYGAGALPFGAALELQVVAAVSPAASA